MIMSYMYVALCLYYRCMRAQMLIVVFVFTTKFYICTVLHFLFFLALNGQSGVSNL